MPYQYTFIRRFCLNMYLNDSATILDKNYNYLLKIVEVIAFCNAIKYYEPPCMLIETSKFT